MTKFLARTGDIPALEPREVRVYALATGDRESVRTVSREILALLLGAAVHALEFDYTSQGKPLLRNDPSLHFSTSHSESVSLIAVTRVAPVGIDIEKIRPVPNAEIILRRFFSPEEMTAVFASPDGIPERFMLAWTRAEATVKVRGGSVWEMATPDPQVTVRNIDVVEGYVGAVAVSNSDWVLTQYPGD